MRSEERKEETKNGIEGKGRELRQERKRQSGEEWRWSVKLNELQAFESELTNQAVAWRTELQEAMEVRASIDLALHNRYLNK